MSSAVVMTRQAVRREERAASKKKPTTFADEDPKQRSYGNVKVRMGSNLAFPVDLAVRKISWIGKSGSGKSYAVGLALEQMRKCGIRFIVLDPVGTHTGIASMQGVVFHEVQRGMHVGRFVRYILENDLNIIVNLRALTFEEQRVFVKLFCENLYRWNKEFGPRHLVVEEVQQFAPQGGKSESKEMLQVLSTMGRMEGIGLSVITQRPAIVDKTVIANTDAFIFFQLMMPQDLGAVTEVLTARTNMADEDQRRIEDIIAKMPSLQKGRAIIYSPEWLQRTEEVSIDGKRVTKHTGQTPDNYIRPMGDEPGMGADTFADGQPGLAPLPPGQQVPGSLPEAPPQVPAWSEEEILRRAAAQAAPPPPPRAMFSRPQAALLALAGVAVFPLLFMPLRAVEQRVRARRGA